LFVPHATARAESEAEPPLPTRLPVVTVSATEAVSTTGFYGVSWDLREDAPLPEEHAVVSFELQEARLPEGESADAAEDGLSYSLLYSGADRATTRTGIPNGRYAYRVRAVMAVRTALAPDTAATDTVSTAWSNPVVVEV